MGIPERLAKLRAKMEENGIDFYIVPTADFHQSEYVGEHFKARKYITGFSGSAGTAVITKSEAKLWTDGRYFLQAAAELEGTTVELMKMRVEGVPTLTEYLNDALPEGGVLGFDGRVVSTGEGQCYADIAASKGGKVVYSLDLIDEIWEDRPPLSEKPAFSLDIKYTGESTASKLARIRKVMKESGANVHIETALDDICWALNVRGDDIDYFPLILCYAAITEDTVELYVDERKFDDELKASLAKEGVRFHPYNDIYEDIKKYGEGDALLIDTSQLNYALYNNIADSVKKVEQENPELMFKTLKNDVELENIKTAELKDSVAHIRFMKWLKENAGKIEITELSASDKLDEFRKAMGNYLRPSFEPLSAYGEHAAIVHYTTTEESSIPVADGNMLLMDTGAGFYEGSTDITRTYAIGELPKYMKEHFTIVAIANLLLANAKFKQGCSGVQLDLLARKPFWDRNLDFDHGTGHGFGYLMNIHEAPINFSYGYRHIKQMDHPFEEGMVFTDEPGIYIAGSHGVRLENNLTVRKGEKNEYGQFMYFEMLSYIPFDLDALDPEIMTQPEKDMVNAYHKSVYEKVSPLLNDEEKEFLKKYTRAI